MVLFHGSTIKEESNEKCNDFCHVFSYIGFPMKETLPLSQIPILVCMHFRIHCYVAANVSHLLFLIHTKGLPVFQNSRCFLTPCNINIVKLGNDLNTRAVRARQIFKEIWRMFDSKGLVDFFYLQ
jgi:hypothetical protein